MWAIRFGGIFPLKPVELQRLVQFNKLTGPEPTCLVPGFDAVKYEIFLLLFVNKRHFMLASGFKTVTSNETISVSPYLLLSTHAFYQSERDKQTLSNILFRHDSDYTLLK